MRDIRAITLSILIFGVFSPTLRASFAPGTVAVATAANSFTSFFGATWIYGSGASPVAVSDPPQYIPTAVAFDGSSRLFMSRQVDFTLGTGIYESSNSANTTLPFTAIQLVFVAGGNLLALHEDGRVQMYDSNGNGTAPFSFPHANVRSIDLAADGCTLFYVYQNFDGTDHVGRYDICRRIELSDVAVTLPPFYCFNGEQRQLRILPDATVLVADQNGAERVTTGGAVIQRYAIPAAGSAGWLALALDPQGSDFFVAVGPAGTGGLIFRVDLRTGVSSGPPLEFPATGRIRSLAVAGEWRAASAAAAVPAFASPALILLAAALLAIGLLKSGHM